MDYVLSVPGQTDYVRVAVAVWAAFGLFVIALWIAAIVWVWRDVTARTDDLFARAAALVPVVLFSIPGLLPYVLLRPQDTREERLQRQFDMETCRRELDQYVACPRCRRRVEVDFVACPYCREALSSACGSCGRQVAHNWVLCPYCARPQPQVARPAAVQRREVQRAPSRQPAPRPQISVRS